MKAPCIDCKTRTPTCHGVCPSYKEWRIKWEKQAKIIKKRENANLFRKNWNSQAKWY